MGKLAIITIEAKQHLMPTVSIRKGMSLLFLFVSTSYSMKVLVNPRDTVSLLTSPWSRGYDCVGELVSVFHFKGDRQPERVALVRGGRPPEGDRQRPSWRSALLHLDALDLVVFLGLYCAFLAADVCFGFTIIPIRRRPRPQRGSPFPLRSTG